MNITASMNPLFIPVNVPVTPKTPRRPPIKYNTTPLGNEDIVSTLRQSYDECTSRCLTASAKWASELLMSIPARRRTKPSPNFISNPAATSTPARSRQFPPPESPLRVQIANESIASSTPYRHPNAPELKPLSEEEREFQAELEVADADELCAARSAFMCRDFVEASRYASGGKSSKAKFISLYSQFIATERNAVRDWDKLHNNRAQPQNPINDQIPRFLELLDKETNPWLLFLKGLCLSRTSRREEAIEALLLSISKYPWNWSAWNLLSRCLGDAEELSALIPLLPLPATHPLVQMFQILTLNDMHSPTENEVHLCDTLLSEENFPGSLWIMGMRAQALYHMHHYQLALEQFEHILSVCPTRLDNIDIYSNILYVTEKRTQLSRLAQLVLSLDKDRPETCCVVGNHYSLRAEHEKAVRYFRRATQLDRNYLPAWTLMGHEYVEMKNSHAAIDSYRRAVDINRKDYRAWYGLGQAYELLNMHQYALHYYQYATTLRPYDSRLWQAHASCYEELGRKHEAIECLKRARIPADPAETNICLKLAKLHESLDELEESVRYHRRIIDIGIASEHPVQHYSKSCLAYAQYHLLRRTELATAAAFLERVVNSNSEDVSVAQELLKKVKMAINEPNVATGALENMSM